MQAVQVTPPNNMGVTATQSCTNLPCTIDWYGASFVDPSSCGREVVAALEAAGVQGCDRTLTTAGKGQNGYGHSTFLFDRRRTMVATVLSGGVNPGFHVRATGAHASGVAGWLRDRFPDHRVSRVDVATDFDEPDAWDKLNAALRGFQAAYENAGKKLKFRAVGDDQPDRDVDAGRTIYIGSRKSSAAFVRLYEKGKQVSEVENILSEGTPFSTDVVRLELEYKPQTLEAKIAAARQEPATFWNNNKWTIAMLHRVFEEEVNPILYRKHRDQDAERALKWMAMQYRSTIESVVSARGWEGMNETIRKVWSELDRSDVGEKLVFGSDIGYVP